MKKLFFINVIIAFLLSFIWHFTYDLLPSFITSIFFPVNESIWEHMKILYGCIMVSSLITYFIFRKKYQINNFLLGIVSKMYLSIIFYLIIFIPIYLFIGENLIFSIGLMLVIYIVMELIYFKIINYKELNINVLPYLLLVAGWIVFLLLTYYPLNNFLFFYKN